MSAEIFVHAIFRKTKVPGVLEKYWYYAGIVIMFFVGWHWPSVGLWMKSIHLSTYLIVLAFFLNGFALSSDSLLESMKQWRILLTALLIIFCISPALVYGVRLIIPGGDSLLAHGFQIVSLVPTLFVSAVVLTRVARGNAAVALNLTVTSNMLAIFITPVIVRLTLGASSSHLNPTSMIGSMILTVLIPTVAGQLARKRWEVWAERHAKLITVASQCTILLFIVTGISALPRSVISASVLTVAVIGCVVLHAVLLIIGRFGGILIGIDEPEKRALTFCSAQKSFVFNVLLCEHIFAGNSDSFGLAILPGIVYYLLVLTVDSVIAQWWNTHAVEQEEMCVDLIIDE